CCVGPWCLVSLSQAGGRGCNALPGLLLVFPHPSPTRTRALHINPQNGRSEPCEGPLTCRFAGADQSVTSGVDVEAVTAAEANQGHAGLSGEVGGKAGGRAHGGQDGDAGEGGLLDQLERSPPRNLQDQV